MIPCLLSSLSPSSCQTSWSLNHIIISWVMLPGFGWPVMSFLLTHSAFFS